MEYKLYRKASGNDSGQVLAIIGHAESKIIDAFEVYRIINGDPVQVEVYKDNDIKVYGAGRPLWSEITWEQNGKWDLVTNDLDLGTIAEQIKSDPSAESVTEVIGYFS